MGIHKVLSCLLVLALVIFCASAANAQALGQIWQNDTSDNADTPVSSLSGLPNAQFSTPNVNFNSNITGYTPSLFLNSPTFFNQLNGFNPNGYPDPPPSGPLDLNNSHVLITGVVLLAAGANTFDVIHDDGVNISFGAYGGVDDPGSTAAKLDTFTVTVPSNGLYPFVLNYNECCGAPAVLEWYYTDTTNPVPTVPEPCTMLLMGSGLVGLAAYRKFKKP